MSHEKLMVAAEIRIAFERYLFHSERFCGKEILNHILPDCFVRVNPLKNNPNPAWIIRILSYNPGEPGIF
jgi:hypothetical protein